MLKMEEVTIEQRIEVLNQEATQAQTQINEWNAVLLKKLGAIEVLEQMLPDSKE